MKPPNKPLVVNPLVVDPKRELLEYERLLKQEVDLREGLPFLYGWKWYKWAREFFDSTNRLNLLVAGNQLSKSSSQIRKCLDWATNQKKWPLLWRTKPIQFWYLYPTKDVATTEFETKWIREFLPRGKFKDDPYYGWKSEYKDGDIFSLNFNSGVVVYFKTYAQNVQYLQTATAYAIFADEELPEHLYDELTFRLAATDGYFHMVFTATLGQELWRCAMEERGTKDEKFPDALKLCVSAYDCLQYDDGTPSHWTPERIQRIINSCKSQNEVLKRVFGRFVVDSGLKYPSFVREKNVKQREFILDKSWRVYSGVDIGSGGSKGHPAAIAFVAVNPEYTRGIVFRGWRGDGVDTTSSDILNKYIQLRGGIKCVAQHYDWHSRDFFNYAIRIGEAFTPAEKGQDFGEDVVNVLFKNNMLEIIDGDEELNKLIIEFMTLRKSTSKVNARDDFTDALRYAVTKIPWDWSQISDKALEEEKVKIIPTEMDLRRGVTDLNNEELERINEEIDEWNEQYGN